MTIEAKKRVAATKKARIRRDNIPYGEIRRNSAGGVEMIEFTEYERNPNAPQLFVNKVVGIYRVGEIIKCTFGLAIPSRSGIVRVSEIGSLLWEHHAVVEANEAFDWAFKEIRRGSFVPDDGGGRRPRTQ